MTESNPSAVLIPNLLWRTLHGPCWVLCRTWLRVNCSGLENIDNTKGGLLLVNHQSFLDPLLVALWLIRPVSFLARDSLYKLPVLGCAPTQGRNEARANVPRAAAVSVWHWSVWGRDFSSAFFPKVRDPQVRKCVFSDQGFWQWCGERISLSIPSVS